MGSDDAASTATKEEPPTATMLVADSGVSAPLVAALTAAGISSLTPVQTASLPHLLAGRDILAKAKTGTGKTMAFLLPTVQNLINSRAAALAAGGGQTLPNGADPVRAIVLSSARELASQILVQAELLTKNLDWFRIDSVLGGSSIIPQRERLDPVYAGSGVGLKKNEPYGGVVDLLVATPGRFIEHLEHTEMTNFHLRVAGVEVLILDEVDCLLDGGFELNIRTIVAAIPAARQTLAFSATVPKKLLGTLGVALKADHVVVDCVGEAVVDTHAKVKQTVTVHPLELSLTALLDCLQTEMKAHPDDYKVLAFLPTARQTQFSAAVMTEMGLDVLEIHSRRSAGERVAASDTFRLNSKQIMLSSDVSARGVDYPDVTAVVQVGSPASKEVYIQRLGRTGRAGKAGSGTLLLCDYEKSFYKEQLKGLPIELLPFDVQADSPEAVAKAAEVQAAAGRVSDDLATQTYRAWLMAMVGQRKALRWSKQDMVNHANLFAAKCLGRATTPTLQPDLVLQMGLAGLEGIVVADGPSEEELLALEAEEAAEEEEVFELSLKINKKELGGRFNRDAQKVEAVFKALGQDAVMALQAKLEAEGSAEVPGEAGAVYKILPGDFKAEMVLVPKKAKSMSRSSSASSLAMGRSMSAMSLNSTFGSSASLSTMGTTSRNASSASLSTLAEGKKVVDPEAVKAAEARVMAAGMQLGQATKAAAAAPEDAGLAAALVAAKAEAAEAKVAKANAKKGV